ncbi:MAG: flavin reductase family protein [Oscillospiraceae bacterium]|jgi:flavin reductase (DIM6/NTAB) family NADH-FMN oxidoreductase RutF|nr:flavin reductase family protein [Oscillospiraceae bacterium]
MKIDLSSLAPREAHDLLTSAIIPRPIAWVSTVNKNGDVNLAPFSFFTGVQWYPPVIAFSVVNREDGSKKDTVVNIEQIPEFVVHSVSVDLLMPMEASAQRIPIGRDIQEISGIHLIASDIVIPPRICEAAVAFECSLEKIITVNEGANAGNLILGRVKVLHTDDTLIENGREIDWAKLNALGRLSGNRYCEIRDVIRSETN